MDFSLHSFILVVGLMVIAFIVYDGIKKVRETKANQLDQDIDLLANSDSIPSTEDLSHLDDLEIADDLGIPDPLEYVDEVVTQVDDRAHQIGTLSEDTSSELAEKVDLDESKAELVQTLTQPTRDVTVTNHNIAEKAQEIVELEQNIVSEESEVVLESFSVNDEIVVEIADEVPPSAKPQKPSKAEMMAKALEAERLAREAQALEEEQKLEAEQVKVNEKEPVPVLMEPVELGKEVDPNPPVQQELHLPEFVQQTLNEEPEEIITANIDEPEIEALDFEEGDTVIEKQKVPQQERVGERLADRPAAQEIFVINVIKEREPLLQGAELNHIFKVCDMRFGEMDIFHRFEQANAQGKIQFSVVNAVSPGKFDMNTIDAIETPGISLFMSLPGPENPMEAFDAMAEVALVFSRNFNANLYDESHSDLTPQTLEHYRHRIREFSRKQSVKK